MTTKEWIQVSVLFVLFASAFIFAASNFALVGMFIFNGVMDEYFLEVWAYSGVSMVTAVIVFVGWCWIDLNKGGGDYV